jgi:hypothetical protein
VRTRGLLDEPTTRHRHRAYGVELACDFALPTWAGAASADEAREIVVTAVDRATLDRLSSEGGTVLHRATVAGGAELTVHRGAGGDHLIRCGAHAFHLDAGRRRLLCAPPSQPDVAWWHALLDWATYCAAAIGGGQFLHASAVALEGLGAVAIAAPAGGGKTTLAAELVAAGARFVCDDALALELRDGLVVAHPGTPFACLDRSRAALADRLGGVCGELGGELWVAIGEMVPEALPLAAVVVLDRRPEGPERPLAEPAGFLALPGLEIGFAGAGAGSRRFDLLATLAEQAPPLRLRASSATTPAALAAALLERLGSRSAP